MCLFSCVSHTVGQVSELDKTAKRLSQKRMGLERKVDEDTAELHHVEAQIKRIHERSGFSIPYWR